MRSRKGSAMKRSSWTPRSATLPDSGEYLALRIAKVIPHPNDRTGSPVCWRRQRKSGWPREQLESIAALGRETIPPRPSNFRTNGKVFDLPAFFAAHKIEVELSQ